VALKDVEYTAYAVSEGTEIAFAQVSLEVSAPTVRAGAVVPGRLIRYDAKPLNW
jgi:phage-related protein